MQIVTKSVNWKHLGESFLWECHDCHEGVVIAATYKNNHGEIMKIDSKLLGPNTEVVRF